MSNKVTVIGAAIVDIMAGSVDAELFDKGSVPAHYMGISCGGDALNESITLSNLGICPEIITLLGNDNASKTVLKCLHDNSVSTEKITISDVIPTGMNIVLVDGNGERYFITNPEGSLRKLSKEHILPYTSDMGDIVSFASIFVSPKLSVSHMAEIFKAVKEKPQRILVADMTSAKNGESIEDLEPILGYIDYIIPNEKEAALLTGKSDPYLSAKTFLEHGAKCVIVKCGRNGCIYETASQKGTISAYPAKAIDTTGAGDSFVSGFIYGLTQSVSLDDCCRYGCAVSSIVVEHMGTQNLEITIEEVNKRFSSLKSDL